MAMKHLGVWTMTVLISAAFSAVAEKVPFSNYQSVVDRQMFGPLPADFDPTKMPSEVARMSSSEQKALTKEQEALQSSIHFSMINVTPDGQVEVGFSDKSNPKVPRHYCLKVGESRDGWTVLEADPQEATTVLAKGEIEVSLTIGADSSKGGGTTTKASAEPEASGAASLRTSNLSRGMSGSLLGRRRKREEERKLQDEADNQRREAERKQREEKQKQENELLRQDIINELKNQFNSMQAEKRQKEQSASESSDKPSDNENDQTE